METYLGNNGAYVDDIYYCPCHSGFARLVLSIPAARFSNNSKAKHNEDKRFRYCCK